NDERNFKNQVQKNLENFAIHFSALKNAIPLANFTFELNEVSEIKNLMKEIIKTAEDKIHIDWKKSPALPKDDFLKVLFSLSLYIGIVKILKNTVNLRRDEEGMDIDSIENFKKIYEALGLTLNSTFLGKEVYNLKEGKDEHGNTLMNKAIEEWRLLSGFLKGLQSEVNERNFFAHAGFERNITEVRKSGEKLYFRYKEGNKEEIKVFLKNNI
ncbi:MAG: TM1812 family CRISPR-associated protein, partial [bacterium]